MNLLKRQTVHCVALLAFCVLPAGCGQPSYDLHATAQQGDVYRTVTSMVVQEGQLVLQANGQTVRGTARLQFESVTEADLLQVEEGRPLRIKVSLLESQEVYRMQFVDGSVDETTEEDPLARRSVLFTREDDDWTGKLVGGEPTTEQRTAIEEYGEPWLEDLVPARAVRVGESWTLSGEKLCRQMGIPEGEASGELKMHFEQIVDFNGEPCALLSAQLDVAGNFRGDVEGHLTMSGEGHTYRSLATKVDLSTRISGVLRMDMVLREDGQRVNVTIDGPFVLEETVTKD